MALLEGMRDLVGDLELAASRRAENERQRRDTAARDALGRARAENRRRDTAAQDALGRARAENRRRQTAAHDALGRARAGRQRRETAARTPRGGGAGMIGLRGAPGGDHRENDAREAAERSADIAALRGEVAETLSGFRRDRLIRAAWDAIARTEDERDRQVAAAQEARGRATEILGLGRIWSDHASAVGNLR
jgi:hypothetical protein